jgi:hypothetical protein
MLEMLFRMNGENVKTKRQNKKANLQLPPHALRARAWWPAFLDEMSRTCNVGLACEAAKISRSAVYLAKKNPEFAEKYEQAEARAIERLESEAWRRGHDGYEEPVFGRVAKDTDGQIGTIRKYSDQLLIQLLKAHKPSKYRETQRLEHTGANGGPIQSEDVTGLNDAELIAKLSEILAKVKP